MRDPKVDLGPLIRQGRALRAETEALVNDAKMLNSRLAIGGTVLRLLDVEGRRDSKEWAASDCLPDASANALGTS
jgi:hypothetical protein